MTAEDLTADVLRIPLERPFEGDVRALGRQAPLAVDEAEEARCVVRDGVQELALALLLHLEPMALRHVDPGNEDEPTGTPGDVGDGHSRPQERMDRPIRRAHVALDLSARDSCRRQ